MSCIQEKKMALLFSVHIQVSVNASFTRSQFGAKGKENKPGRSRLYACAYFISFQIITAIHNIPYPAEAYKIMDPTQR